MTVEIATRLTFEAAHRLDRLPKEHKCFNLHGHNYTIEVVARGPVDPGLGWVCDYGMLDAAIREVVISQLDHRYLNDIPGLEVPTGEAIAIWVFERLRIVALPADIIEVTVWETPHYRATVRA